MRTRRLQKAKRAFTLIEILIVVVILGILAAIIIPQFAESADSAKISSTRSQLQTLRSQIELYKFKEGTIPANFAALVSDNYMQAVPVAPEPYVFDYDATTGAVTVGCITGGNCDPDHATW